MRFIRGFQIGITPETPPDMVCPAQEISMAEIIPFTDAGRRFPQRKPSSDEGHYRSAEILFFTGVRYERCDDNTEKGATGEGLNFQNPSRCGSPVLNF
jgi:hypothetical protein